MEKNGACKIGGQKNAVFLERLGKGRLTLKSMKKEEKKLTGPLAKKELPALEGMINGKNIRGRIRYQMIDNIMINELDEDMKRKAEKWVGWRMLSLQ